MKASIALIAAASVAFFSTGTVLAQAPASNTAETPKEKPAAAVPSKKKPKTAGQAAKPGSADKPLKAGHYATEAEAKSRCGGAVVWVGSEGFTHYRGSREYGQKPGSFTCDK
jgi:hypothetical protein